MRIKKIYFNRMYNQWRGEPLYVEDGLDDDKLYIRIMDVPDYKEGAINTITADYKDLNGGTYTILGQMDFDKKLAIFKIPLSILSNSGIYEVVFSLSFNAKDKEGLLLKTPIQTFEIVDTIESDDEAIAQDPNYPILVDLINQLAEYKVDTSIFPTREEMMKTIEENLNKTSMEEILKEVQANGYITLDKLNTILRNYASKADLSGYAKESDLNKFVTNLKFIQELDKYVLKTSMGNYVLKETGKGLSTHDLTDELYEKLVNLDMSNGEVNIDLTEYQKQTDDRLTTTDKTIVGSINEIKNSIPTKTSQLQNDSGYLTEHQDLSDYATKSELHNHDNKNILDNITQDKFDSWDNKSEFSGSYNDLTDKPIIPTIPDIPTKVSQLENDSNYATESFVTDKIIEADLGGNIDLSEYAKTSDIPTKVSQLENDSRYVNRTYAENLISIDVRNFLLENTFIDCLNKIVSSFISDTIVFGNYVKYFYILRGRIRNISDNVDLPITINNKEYNNVSYISMINTEYNILTTFIFSDEGTLRIETPYTPILDDVDVYIGMTITEIGKIYELKGSSNGEITECHTHTNKDILDTITSTMINNWNNKSNVTINDDINSISTTQTYSNSMIESRLEEVGADITAVSDDLTSIDARVTYLEDEQTKMGSFDGSYDSLTNKPTIPTKTSELTNDSGFTTKKYVDDKTEILPVKNNYIIFEDAVPRLMEDTANTYVISDEFKDYIFDSLQNEDIIISAIKFNLNVTFNDGTNDITKDLILEGDGNGNGFYEGNDIVVVINYRKTEHSICMNIIEPNKYITYDILRATLSCDAYSNLLQNHLIQNIDYNKIEHVPSILSSIVNGENHTLQDKEYHNLYDNLFIWDTNKFNERLDENSGVKQNLTNGQLIQVKQKDTEGIGFGQHIPVDSSSSLFIVANTGADVIIKVYNSTTKELIDTLDYLEYGKYKTLILDTYELNGVSSVFLAFTVKDSVKNFYGNTYIYDLIVYNNSSFLTKGELLTKTNTDEYHPTGDYNPATKKYVDDNIGTEVRKLDLTNQSIQALAKESTYDYVSILSTTSISNANYKSGEVGGAIKRFFNATISTNDLFNNLYKERIMITIYSEGKRISRIYEIRDKAVFNTVIFIPNLISKPLGENSSAFQIKYSGNQSFDSTGTLIDDEGKIAVGITLSKSFSTEENISILDNATIQVDRLIPKFIESKYFKETPTEDKDLATKKYVDDTKFSKNYEDLNNEPFTFLPIKLTETIGSNGTITAYCDVFDLELGHRYVGDFTKYDGICLYTFNSDNTKNTLVATTAYLSTGRNGMITIMSSSATKREILWMSAFGTEQIRVTKNSDGTFTITNTLIVPRVTNTREFTPTSNYHLVHKKYVDDKVDGINASTITGLSTVATSGDYNDLTNKPTIPSEYTLPTASATQLGGIKVGAGLSINDGVLSANGGGTADSVDWSNVQNKPTIPSKVSQLTNDSGFITSVPSEYITETELNAKGYLTEHQNISGKVDKVDGKGLSTNDLTNTLKANYDTAYTHSQSTHAPNNAQKNSDITKTEIEAKLTGNITTHTHSQYLTSIPNEYITETELNAKGYATEDYVTETVNNASMSGGYTHPETHPASMITGLSTVATSGSYNDLTNKPTIPSIEGLATETYVNNKVAGLVDSAPEALNTLNELATALGNDANFATTVSTQIGTKVDKVDGKSLVLDTEISKIHEHGNKDLLDTIEADNVHAHSNKSVIDAITSDMTTKWNKSIPFENTYVSDCDTWLTNGYTKTSTSTTHHPSVCTGADRWGVLFYISENAQNGTGTQMYFPIDGTYAGRVFTRKIVNRSAGAWNLLSTFNGDYNDLTNKPTIPSEYTLPTASADTLGGIKVGAGLSINDGVLSANGGGTADSVDWSNVQNRPTVLSQFTNDSGFISSIPSEYITETELNAKGYLTEHQDISGKVDKVNGKGLSTNDLTDDLKANYDSAYEHSQSAHAPSNAQKNSDITKAEIEAKLTGNITTHTHSQYLTSIPNEYITETELNAKGYLTEHQSLEGYAKTTDLHSHSNKAILDGISSTNISNWNSAYNHSTSTHAPGNAQKNSDITKAEIEAKLTGNITTHTHSQYLTEHQSLDGYVKTTDLSTVATTGSYNDLTDKPTIPSAYTHPSTHPASMITGLSKVATSGSYNDLSNKPTIPTIPNSLPANGGNADTVNNFRLWKGTQAQYDAITTKDSNTIYMITE